MASDSKGFGAFFMGAEGWAQFRERGSADISVAIRGVAPADEVFDVPAEDMDLAQLASLPRRWWSGNLRRRETGRFEGRDSLTD
jgi:hypothetical protein